MDAIQVKTRQAGKAEGLRRTGYVPGVVYGPEIESLPISIARKELHALFSRITRSSRITLKIEGDGKGRQMDVFVKVVDYDPLTDEPIHVDFYHPEKGHPLKLHVPVKVVGEPAGLKAGGVMNVLFNTVRVHGLPKDIPHLITIDVSGLNLGESIHVRDVDFGDVEPMLPGERTLVTVMAPRSMAALEEEAEEGAEEAGEAEGEGAEASAEGSGSEGTPGE